MSLYFKQTFKLLTDESREDKGLVVSLWKHEMNRVVRDRLCRHGDILWFDETINKVVSDVSAGYIAYQFVKLFSMITLHDPK